MPLNSASLYFTSIGTIGGDKNLQSYKTFGTPKVAFLPHFFKYFYIFGIFELKTFWSHCLFSAKSYPYF